MSPVRKPIRRPEDLVAWTLANQLAELIDACINNGAGRSDPRWIDQIRRASAKTPALIEEGFLRFLPRDSANYYRMARASIGETRSHLRCGLRRRHITPEAYNKAMALADNAMRTTMGLLRSRLERVAQDDQR
jgi:four helix bundle protein